MAATWHSVDGAAPRAAAVAASTSPAPALPAASREFTDEQVRMLREVVGESVQQLEDRLTERIKQAETQITQQLNNSIRQMEDRILRRVEERGERLLEVAAQQPSRIKSAPPARGSATPKGGATPRGSDGSVLPQEEILLVPRCPVCRERGATDICALPCKHVFHIKCIRTMQPPGSGPKRCPVCRAQFKEEGVFELQFEAEQGSWVVSDDSQQKSRPVECSASVQ
eukprot:GHVU01017786.1.p2 GENE.GHVU01017786.1~~GHVU01017786.1.p2  ORF type:complete len:226 (+),score=25.39 GHVU01017786.1:108-785(+)